MSMLEQSLSSSCNGQTPKIQAVWTKLLLLAIHILSQQND
jgi:hypothetical protein